MANDTSFKGRLPTSSDVGYPNNPDTSADYTFEDILDKAAAQIEGLADRGFVDLTSIGGTGDAVTASTIYATTRAPGIATLTTGMRFRYVPTATNTGAVTMEIDDAAVANVKANDGTALAAGYFQIGSSYDLVFNGTNLVVCDVGSSFLAGNRAPDDVFECQRAAGVADGNSTGGSNADDRLLNTEVRQRIASLNTSTGVFTLPPGGPYRVQAWVPMYGSGVGRAELYNTTDSTRAGIGTAVSGGTTAQVTSLIDAIIGPLASAKSYKIRSVHTGSGVTDGLGKPANISSQIEVYTRVAITLIDETNETFEGTPGGALTESYEFEDATTAGDPGAGKLAFDNASIASATKLLIHKSNADGNDIAAHLAYLASGTSTKKAVIRVQLADDDTSFAVLDCGTFTDRTTHYEIAITKIAATGAVDGFTDGDALLVKMDRVGDAGTSGAWTTIVTPAAIGADQNDYDVGSAGRQVVNVEASGAARVITGLLKKATGELVNIRNAGATYNVTLDDANTGSSEANRFDFGRDLVLKPKDSVTLRYNETDSRWNVWAISYPRSEWDATEETVASAATTDIGAATAVRVAISGTTDITSFGTTSDKIRFVRFTGTALTITYNASSMITLTGKNRVVVAGDTAVWVSDGSGNWRERSFTQASLLPGRNYVDNPSFNNWQRATSFTLASATRAVVADRWKVYRNATGGTISRQTGFAVTGGSSSPKYCIRIARDSGNSSTQVIRLWHQLHEFIARGLAGQYVTLSFDVRAGADYSGGALSVAIHTGTAGSEAVDLSSQVAGAFATGGAVTGVSSTVTPTTTAQRVYCTPLLLGTSVADLAFRINYVPSGTAGAADYIEITNVKLEIGAVATAFQPPDEAADLAVCRYTYRTLGYGLTCWSTGTTAIIAHTQLDPPMRVLPAVSLATAALDVYETGTAGTKSSSGSTISRAGSAGDQVLLTINGWTTLIGARACLFATANAIVFDAELL